MPSGLIQPNALDHPRLETPSTLANAGPGSGQHRGLQIWAAVLVVLPVFLQAPWVRLHPFSACVFTAVLLALAISLELQQQPPLRLGGSLLLGFSGSWLAGSLFWGWLRAHPSWHLPVEAIALPLALTGLSSRWRLGCAFYLASLVGTAITDLAMALTGVMRFWPEVVQAQLAEAGPMLNTAAASLRHPLPLLVMIGLAAVILSMANSMQSRSRWSLMHSECWAVGASVLVTTVMVDGLFLLMALVHPSFSGLI